MHTKPKDYKQPGTELRVGGDYDFRHNPELLRFTRIGKSLTMTPEPFYKKSRGINI